ncbi:glycosyltransferase family 4 protein [Embleya scabrispora]|uniref:glycosyltransferase family 4 protein n=1 Tax=Embleya scabrispora TaxID=159449 RepID=UPI00036846E9|nr:glycosyltransferase family 4 protein [Embleya scabrispora]MYS83475.1 glycosyltransferase [Streptomyces sp. SID5474]
MRVMAFGTYDTTVHPRVGILIEGLRRHGIEVVTCNVPLGHMDAGPMVPPPSAHPGIPRQRIRHARCIAELVAKARRVPRPDVVIVGYQGRLDIQIARRLFPGIPLVLDHLESVDDVADRLGQAAQAELRKVDRIEQAAIAAARLVLVDTEEHRRVLTPGQRDRAVVVPIGAAPVWFDAGRASADPDPATGGADAPGSGADPAHAAPPGDTGAGLPADFAPDFRPGEDLRVISFGLYSPVQGAPVIGAALSRLDGYPIAVTMIGRGLQAQRTRDLVGPEAPRVTWRTWVPEAELPRLVAAHDVCLGVFGTGAKALRLVPNKVFQGAAAGCAVLTSDTAPQRRLFGPAGLFVPAGDSDALADALRRLAQHPAEVDRLRAAAVTLARERFVPEAVVAPLVERLREIVDKRA